MRKAVDTVEARIGEWGVTGTITTELGWLNWAYDLELDKTEEDIYFFCPQTNRQIWPDSAARAAVADAIKTLAGEDKILIY